MLTAAKERRREGRWGGRRIADKEERRKGIPRKRKSELNSKEKWKIKETH